MKFNRLVFSVFFLPIAFGSDQFIGYELEAEFDDELKDTNLLSIENTQKLISNETDQYLVLSSNCSVAFDNFSRAIVNVTSCFIKYARPIHVCMKCSNKYQVLVEAYETLKKQGTDCSIFFFSSDQMSIIDMIYKGATDLWSKSNCQDCYDHLDETKLFFEGAHQLIKCLMTFNESKLGTNDTCAKCHLTYVNLSQSYDKFVNWNAQFDGGICMDVIDTMNISRRLWTENECSVVFGTSIGYANVLTALTIGATPFMFYLLAKNISRLDDVKLVRPKRKYTTVNVPAQTVQDN